MTEHDEVDSGREAVARTEEPDPGGADRNQSREAAGQRLTEEPVATQSRGRRGKALPQKRRPSRASEASAKSTASARWLKRHAIDITPLRHRAYRRMFVGTAVSAFGYQFTAVAVPVQMYALTHSSTWVGFLGVAALVPLLVFALWGGAVADALDRRRVLLGSSLLLWSATLGLLVQALAGVRSPGLLLALVAVQSTGFAINSPTRGAIVPRLVTPAEVPSANTLNFTTFTAGGVLGPLGAGLLLAHYPVWAAYAVDGTLFAVVLWSALGLPKMPPDPNAAPPRARLRDVAYGLRFIAQSRLLLLSFAIDIAAMVLALPRALFPQAAAERFGGPGAVGWLYSAIALGSVLAGLTSGWIGRVRRQGVALAGAVVAWGLAVAGAGLMHALWACVVLLGIAGAADLVSAVYRQTILQTYAPDQLRGRMQGVFTAVVAGGPRLGDLRAGLMAGLGLTADWVGGGVAAAVVAVLLALTFPALLRYTAP
jgi:MFS family permease